MINHSNGESWYMKAETSDVHSCFCRGPQNGQPLCPCQMRGVTIKDGRYVKVQDLGPVNEGWGGLG